jgi:hypothetical protein
VIRPTLSTLLPLAFLVSCVEAGQGPSRPEAADAGTADESDASGELDQQAPQPVVACATPAVESWTGTAGRDNDSGYPDHIAATVTWTRARTLGCVDHYTPSGTATYAYAIPGALCTQSISPASHEIAATDGELTIDRTTSPATFVGHAATTWTITHHCVYDDGRFDDQTREGGATWFDASGTLNGGALDGSFSVEDDSARCGPQGIAPCTYSWSFASGTP